MLEEYITANYIMCDSNAKEIIKHNNFKIS